MRIRLLSDLHFEFHRDGGVGFIQQLNPEGVDVLVLAGDIAKGAAIPKVLALFCQRFAASTVLYVHGNHEFYKATRDNVVGWTKEAVQALPNLRWLDCDVVEVRGRRFLGAPLWFPEDPMVAHIRKEWSDFIYMPKLRGWVYKENARAVEFFKRELRKDDIVITHYLPSYRSVSSRYRNDPCNSFFVCDMERVMAEHAPALWLHGHTHDSSDYMFHNTRVLCNPFGYPHAINRKFKLDLVEVASAP